MFLTSGAEDVDPYLFLHRMRIVPPSAKEVLHMSAKQGTSSRTTALRSIRFTCDVKATGMSEGVDNFTRL